MDTLNAVWSQADGVGRLVALLVLLMSVVSWVLIVWKAWVLARASRDLDEGLAALWAAPNLEAAQERLSAIDREQVLLPLWHAWRAPRDASSWAAHTQADAQLTRRLREALQLSLAHLRTGQVVLASIGSTAPFVGLFGTVWGIYHALVNLAAGGQVTVEQVAGPVGEALVMTAAGLVVAIPAVLAYNFFGKLIGQAESRLEGLAHDLLQAQAQSQGVPA